MGVSLDLGDPPRVVVGPGAAIGGTLRFGREVKLYVSDRAEVGRIEGATPVRFSGDTPPRTDASPAGGPAGARSGSRLPTIAARPQPALRPLRAVTRGGYSHCRFPIREWSAAMIRALIALALLGLTGWALTQPGGVIALLFVVAVLYLAYRRLSLLAFTLTFTVLLAAYTVLGAPAGIWKGLLWIVLAGLWLFNLRPIRKALVSRPFLRTYRKLLPAMSQTEKEALEAGTVWWDGELFSGNPDWSKLLSAKAPQLTAEEQAFLDGPCEELCRMIDDFDITHRRGDMPPEVWDFLKSRGFFAMIIRKEYGGLEFSAYAHSCVLAKLAGRSTTVSSTVAVPNSLGPAELLQHYGLPEQQNYYLPRLARGEEIPCFALTGPRAGSDAASMPDTGIVSKGMWEGREIVGLKLNFSKRYITLAPVATVIGLAFRMYDPDKLLGDRADLGITCALIPRGTAGVTIGRRHFPLNIPFQNGPIQGKDVFVPLEFIIGGPKMAGQGWRMLVEQLSVGRCISLPSNGTGGAKAAVFATGAYARIRRQFNMPVGKFEGVETVIARMVGYAYTMDAARSVTAGAIDGGEKPSVPSAMLKYHITEMSRQVANDAMDIAGGKGICPRAPQLSGPRLPGAAGGDHRRRREHPDAQPDHLRPGRGALPSVRAEGDGSGAQSRSRAGRRPIRPRAVRPHRLHDQQCRAVAADGADQRALHESPGRRA